MIFTTPERPCPIEVRSAIPYGAVPGLPAWQGTLHLDLLLPTEPASAPRPAVIYLHGGGWRAGERSAGLYPWLSPLLAAHGFVAANVTYRLSGEAAFPAQAYDVKAAVRWLRQETTTYGIDPERIGIWGDSAGGQLAALIGATGEITPLEGDCGSPDQSSGVQAVIMRCAPSDFTTMPDTQAEVLDALFGGGPAETMDLRRLASPANHVHSGLPPYFVVHGTEDETVPFSQAQHMIQVLRDHQVPTQHRIVEGGHHNLLPNVDLPRGNEPWTALGEEALAFFRQAL